jgi:hypothetical protein
MTKRLGAGVTESLMPQISRHGGETFCGGGCWRREGIEITGTVTAEKHRLGVAILDRETKIVKFNGNWIVTCEGTD